MIDICTYQVKVYSSYLVCYNIFQEIGAILVQKLRETKIFGYFKTKKYQYKKILMPLSSGGEGGGGGLNGTAIKKITFFCSFPNNYHLIFHPVHLFKSDNVTSLTN